MKVFIDTNVLASAFATRGLCADVFRLVLAEHELVTGEIVLRELQDVLKKKFGFPDRTIEGAVALLSRHQIEPVVSPVPAVAGVSDKADWAVLAAADRSNADILITGDKEVRAIGNHHHIKIVTPREFWGIVREQTT